MTGTQLTKYDEQLARLAEQAQALERTASRDFFSTKAGQLTYNDEEMPGNQVAAVIIDAVREQAYYPEAYTEKNKVPPTCFAFGRGTEDEMVPHLESMAKDQNFFVPQHMVGDEILGCKSCPKNQWGTADVGEGKACKSKMRLTLLPAGLYEPVGKGDFQLGLFDTAKEFETVSPAYLSVPVTSGKAWSDYSRMLRTKFGRPPLGVFTRVYLTPHKDHQFHVNFELIEQVPNELLGLMIERGATESAEPFRGYEAPKEEERQQNRGFKRR